MPVSPPLNPIMMLLEGNGSLAGRDRAGAFTATGSGALRYAPAPGARINLARDPHFVDAAGATNWKAYGPGVTRTNATFLGRTAGRVTRASGSGITGITHKGIPVIPGMQYRISASIAPDALSNPADTYQMRVDSSDLTNVFSGALAFSPPIAAAIPVATWTKFEVTVTAPASGYIVVSMYATGQIPGEETYCSELLVELGSTTQPFFSGATTGAVWLDPLTGILGTAHASPSVSRAQFWVEEATTNVITNPSAEVDTTGFVAQGVTPAVLTRATTRAYFGAASLKVVAGGGSTFQGFSQVATVAVGAVTFSVYLNGTVGDAYRIIMTGSGLTTQTQTGTLAVTGWNRLTFATTSDAAVSATFRVDGSSVAHAFTWYVDGMQVEQKAYATSYCDGSLGTGYTWAGTAHASASTRADTRVRVPVATHFDSSIGSAIYGVVPATAGGVVNRYSFGAGTYGTNDFISVRHGVSAFVQGYTRVGGASELILVSAVNTNAVRKIYLGWSGANVEFSGDGEALKTGSRTAPQGATSTFVGLGHHDIHVQHMNGFVGPTMFYDQPLSPARRTMVNAAIDSNGTTDLWTLFEEWEGVLSPLDVNVTSQTVAATAGASAILQPLDVFALGTGSATAGASAIIQPLDIDMGDGTVKGYGARPSRYLVIPSPPDIDLDIPNEQDAP